MAESTTRKRLVWVVGIAVALGAFFACRRTGRALRRWRRVELVPRVHVRRTARSWRAAEQAPGTHGARGHEVGPARMARVVRRVPEDDGEGLQVAAAGAGRHAVAGGRRAVRSAAARGHQAVGGWQRTVADRRLVRGRRARSPADAPGQVRPSAATRGALDRYVEVEAAPRRRRVPERHRGSRARRRASSVVAGRKGLHAMPLRSRRSAVQRTGPRALHVADADARAVGTRAGRRRQPRDARLRGIRGQRCAGRGVPRRIFHAAGKRRGQLRRVRPRRRQRAGARGQRKEAAARRHGRKVRRRPASPARRRRLRPCRRHTALHRRRSRRGTCTRAPSARTTRSARRQTSARSPAPASRCAAPVVG